MSLWILFVVFYSHVSMEGKKKSKWTSKNYNFNAYICNSYCAEFNSIVMCNLNGPSRLIYQKGQVQFL